ncbi:MAG: Ig-like domain-containing protein [Prevotellaceae bacterium]|nr:Ig-like domain-containing protein [Prevotellaceae bacterium]
MKNKILLIALIFCAALILKSCANMAQGPTGGNKDEIPPEFLRSMPSPNALNFRKNKVEIEFNEYIILDNPTKNLVVSPTQDQFPVAKGIGRKVTVELLDSLLENTTYTIDFGNSITDNNEKNPVSDYVFTFSTGPVVDTMQVSGTVLNAENLAPVAGVYAGVYTNLDDSAFTSFKMERITRTNPQGNFFIRNLAEKPYRLYALEDANNNYFFDLPTEKIATQEEIVTPRIELEIVKDTTGSDSLTTVETIRFLPDSLILFFYQEEDKRQFFIKQERSEAWKFTLYFKNITKKLPEITPVNFEGEDWVLSEPSVTKDTLVYWITDSLIFMQDTLLLAIDYEKTDSLEELVPQRDTITLLYKGKKLSRREKKEGEDKMIFTQTLSTPSVVEVYNKPVIQWSRPLMSFGKENVSLTVKKDTLWNDIDFRIEQDSSNFRTYFIIADLEPGKEYKMQIDSASVTDILGFHNDKIEAKFKIRSKEEYSNLFLLMKNAPEKMFVQLLNKNDMPVMQSSAMDGKVTFQYVKPGEYYLRLIDDRNGNGRWDTGNFKAKIQPEQVFYYNKPIKLRVNWDVEEEWDVTAVPLQLQRPPELKSKSN